MDKLLCDVFETMFDTMRVFNILVDPTGAPKMTPKLDVRADFELVAPYFSPN